jgi:hypothetical protein
METEEEILEVMKTEVQNDDVLAPKATSTSAKATWLHLLQVVSHVMSSFIGLFKVHKQDVNTALENDKAHRAQWYQSKAFLFQFGDPLLEFGDIMATDSDFYETVDEEKQIIKYCAVSEDVQGRVEIKVAADSGSDPIALTTEQLEAFTNYMNEIKDEGVKLVIISDDPDDLRVLLDVYYDPLVLNADGARIDGTANTPVLDAISDYITSLPFNGEYTNMALVDRLQEVEGVKIPELKSSLAKYAAFDFTTIQARYTAYAGYLKLVDDIDDYINYIPYS